MTKNRIFLVGILAVLLAVFCPLPAYAEDTPTFAFVLTSDGADTVEVSPGDVVTVSLNLRRTDADAPCDMYAMQDELRYDSTFFELVDDGAVVAPDIRTADVEGTDGTRRFYMNYLSMSGGTEWQADTRIGSIKLRVIGQSGVSQIENTDYLVSKADGTDSFVCTAQNVKVVVSTECTVRFAPRGGSEVPAQIVQYGEKVTRPQDPTRDGYAFDGWFADIDLTEPWDFETDTVKANMTLYAAWKEATEEIKTEVPREMPYGWILAAVLAVVLILVIYKQKKRR